MRPCSRVRSVVFGADPPGERLACDAPGVVEERLRVGRQVLDPGRREHQRADPDPAHVVAQVIEAARPLELLGHQGRRRDHVDGAVGQAGQDLGHRHLPRRDVPHDREDHGGHRGCVQERGQGRL